MSESNEEKGPLAQWRDQNAESQRKVTEAQRLEKERLAKEEEDRLAAEAGEEVQPPTREDVENLKGWVAPMEDLEGPHEKEPGDKKQAYLNVEGPGEPEVASEELPEEFKRYMNNIAGKGKEEKKQIKVPHGFEVTRIFYNEDGDATSIVVEKKEKIWKFFAFGVLTGSLLLLISLLLLLTFSYALPDLASWMSVV